MPPTFSFEEVIDTIGAAKNVEELSSAISSLREPYGLANIVYHAVHIPGCAHTNPILILSYENAWVKRYTERDYFSLDPVIKSGRKAFLPIDWSETDRYSLVAQRFFSEAESFGVGRQGITIPVRGPSGERALLTVTSNASAEEWRGRRSTYIREFHALAHFVHDRAVKLSGLRRNGAPTLSRRERECLQLLARGRVPKLIARDLNLSESAIRLYLKSARHKLGCGTMNRTIAFAINHELIDA
ncbi:MAG: LuxR family transcriptional regulator [Hyphomicrobiales bacterium]|nr:LuxR family transcriptional regulator [Hyphomicrobiales bacterium]